MKERKPALEWKALTMGLFIRPLKFHLQETVLRDQLKAAEEIFFQVYFL